MTRARFYRVQRPCTPGYEGKWCVAWQTAVMPGISFWYFDTITQARNTEARLRFPRLRTSPAMRRNLRKKPNAR